MAVIDNAFETKGSELFFAYSSAVVKMLCPTGISGINGGSKDKIDTTCLDNTGSFRTYVGGFADASEVTVPFVLYDGAVSHQDLFALQASGAVVNWMVGLSDDATDPTLDTDDKLVTPASRTTFAFDGYVSQVTIDVATNEVVRGTLVIQPTGFTTANWPA